MARNKLLSLSVLAALSGCASPMMSDIENGVDAVDREAVKAVETMRTGQPIEHAKGGTFVRHVDRAWIPIAKVKEDDLRAAPILARNVVANRPLPDIRAAATYISALTGVRVSVAASAQAQAAQASATAATPATAMNMPPPPMGVTGTPLPGLAEPVTYSGKLSGLLDIVASKFGLYWEVEGEDIRFFKTKSKTFRLAALPGDSSMKSKVGAGGDSGGSTGGTSGSTGGSGSNGEQTAGIEFTGLSVWKGIEESIKTMLTADGKVVVTPATGTVTVDDVPPSLARVEKYVNDQNLALSRQVVVNVRVLTVELNDSDNYGINWNAVYQNVSRGLGVALSSVSGLAAGSQTLAFNVINTNSSWDGTQLMLEALSKQGRVSQITSASLVTINNQPAPIQVGRQRSYLASSTTTIGTGGAGNTTTLTPGVITTGFSMAVLPHILDDGRMMLQYAGDISSLSDVFTVNSGGSSIQTPDIDTRNFMQRVMMKNGETLVLTGFEQFSLTGKKQGIGSANNVLAGGALEAGNNKVMLVVLIQPVIAGGNS